MSSISQQLSALRTDLNSLTSLSVSSWDTCEYEQAAENKRIYEELQNKISEHIDEWVVGLDSLDLNSVLFIRAAFTKAGNHFNHPDRFNEYANRMNYFIGMLEDYANSREN